MNEALSNAKRLRTSQTIAEQRLWNQWRAHRFMSLKFKLQKPIGRYIVDFVCIEQLLIIEIDGGQHAEQMQYDQNRDSWLRGQGYTVLRFLDNEVIKELESVLEQLRVALSHGTETHSPQSTPGAPLSSILSSKRSRKREMKASDYSCGRGRKSPTPEAEANNHF